jgi:hypothetical protein
MVGGGGLRPPVAAVNGSGSPGAWAEQFHLAVFTTALRGPATRTRCVAYHDAAARSACYSHPCSSLQT